MFVSNKRAWFHLWRKENLVKHKKLSKYYENDLDWIIGFVHKTAEIHSFGMSAQLVSAQNGMLSCLAGMN